MPKYPTVFFENEAKHTLYFPVESDEQAIEIAVSELEKCTGLTRDKMVRPVRVEWKEYDEQIC